MKRRLCGIFVGVVALGASLTWEYPTEDTTVDRFAVYLGPASRTYTGVVYYPRQPGYNQTNAVPDNSGIVFYAVTAISTNGLESDYSNDTTIDHGSGNPQPQPQPLPVPTNLRIEYVR